MKKYLLNMPSIFILIAIAAFVYPVNGSARSINESIGTTGFSWLKTVSDAGISAAGDCLAARDGNAGMLVHPAAIAGVTNGISKLSFVSHYVDTQYGSIGYAGKHKNNYLGIRLSYVNYGEFIRTNKAGERLGTFSAGDMGLTLNVAKQVRDDLKIGAMVSLLSSRIEDFTAQAASIDLGVVFTPPFEGLTVGAVLKNIGKVTKSYSVGFTDTLPTMLVIGAKKKLIHSPFSLMGDVIFPNDNDITFAFGIEASIMDRLFLYAGTRSRTNIDTESMDAETDYAGITTFGFGVSLDKYIFNYAYCPDDMIENIHKITLSLQLR